jgi:hypothetical protein
MTIWPVIHSSAPQEQIMPGKWDENSEGYQWKVMAKFCMLDHVIPARRSLKGQLWPLVLSVATHNLGIVASAHGAHVVGQNPHAGHTRLRFFLCGSPLVGSALHPRTLKNHLAIVCSPHISSRHAEFSSLDLLTIPGSVRLPCGSCYRGPSPPCYFLGFLQSAISIVGQLRSDPAKIKHVNLYRADLEVRFHSFKGFTVDLQGSRSSDSGPQVQCIASASTLP